MIRVWGLGHRVLLDTMLLLLRFRIWGGLRSPGVLSIASRYVQPPENGTSQSQIATS